MTTFLTRIRGSQLYPILVLEDLISRRARRVLILFSQILLLIFLVIVVRAWWLGVVSDLGHWLGGTLIGVAATLTLYLLECFFRSYYYRSPDLFSFSVGRILYQAKTSDVWRVFLTSEIGRLVLRRLGIGLSDIEKFLTDRQVPAIELLLGGAQVFTLARLTDWLSANDEDFSKWLFRQDIRGPELVAAADWVERELESQAAGERWWSRENLEHIPGLAKTWAYGETPLLERYGEDLLAGSHTHQVSLTLAARGGEAEQLATVLLRSREANAILVGETGEGQLDVIWQFAATIKAGQVAPALEHRRLWLFHSALFLAAFREREALEQELLRLFAEATRAGNIILVIDNLAALIAGGEHLGADLVALLDPLLVSPALAVIALADNETFHRELESRTALMARFEKIVVKTMDRSRLVNFLEDQANQFEKTQPVFFTYPAILELAESAGRYFQSERLVDQASDLLTELVPWALTHGLATINREVVLGLVKEKTGVPLGVVGGEERGQLLHLENRLREQVVGQERALATLASALLRNRAGVRNLDRPIGSFLFLGPTGVGKTETAKALARTLFGQEEAMMRLDMSEYQAGDALERLIGSFDDDKPGILANLLRQNSYGVILLDEFEKTNREVLNLFLQILDEGYFSDMLGRRVNARNVIFIATSNAGAELVWEMVKSGRDPATAREELVNAIIEKGVFRPELLNRFDEVVIFHPLTSADLTRVARLQLGKFAARLQARGLALAVDDALVARVVARGSDSVFGARPMARYIQDHLEQSVAEAIIRGELRAGSTVSFVGDRLVSART